ncbi:MAG: hypothetical protein CBARDCOR_5458 [uncultured Caballeronia sp.]|nr:MAG: hypothetical protein CBARDCOR_5458 [uncultured Caballeronia sp.]
MRLTAPIFTTFGHDFSWRDLILIAGGAFLVWKGLPRSIIMSPVKATPAAVS